MTKNKLTADTLRKPLTKEEAKINKRIVKLREQPAGNKDKLVNGLRARQIKLEMQNEQMRHTQRELEDSRSRYGDLYDFAPVGYLTFDKNGRIVEANLTSCKMLGVERNALIKKPFHTYISKDSRDRFSLHCQRVFKTVTRQSCEISLVSKDAGTLEVLLESMPAVDADGNLTLCGTAITDITERRQAEKRILDLAKFPEEDPYPVLRISQDGAILYSNGPGKHLLESWSRVAGQTAPSKWCKLVRDVLNSERPRVEEVQLQGRIISLVMVPIAEGGYVNIYGRDITAHKRVERTLRESREDLNRAQAVAQTGSWRLNILRNELTWSDETYRIFGIPKATSLTYDSFLAFIHPDDRDYVDKKWNAALKGEDYDIEHRIVVDGKIKWVREKAFLEFDNKGTLLGGFGITQNITERKQMEDELRQARDELELRVKERTADLDEIVAELHKQVEQRIEAEEDAKAERKRLNDVLETLPAYVVLLTEDYHVPFANRFFEERFGKSDGRRCYEYLFNRTDPCGTCEAFTVLRTNKPHNWEWTGPDGRNYDVYDFPFTDADGSRLIMEMGIDITEKKQAEVRARITNVLLELFAQKTARKEYLDSVVKAIRDWSGCRCVGIRLVNDEGYIPYESCVGFSDQFLRLENMLSLKTDACACIRVIAETPEPQDAGVMTPKGSFRCDDSLEFISKLTEKEKSRFRGNCVKFGFASLAVVPIRYRDKVLGAIHLADEQKNKMSLERVEFLENMAMLVGEAVHRFDTENNLRRSHQQLRFLTAQLSLVEERERRRIASDLHDSVSQILAFASRELRTLTRSSPQKISESLEEVCRQLDLAIHQTRSLSFDLSPSILYDLGLEVAIEDLAERFCNERKISCRFESIPGPKPLAEDVKILLYRAVRELLINVAKHARADSVRVSLARSGNEMLITVEDDGQGFDVGPSEGRLGRPKGFGIFSIRERLGHVGGRLEIASAKGKGTKVTLMAPLAAAKEP